MNWAFFLLRLAIGCGILTALFLSQRFWYRGLWRLSANWGAMSLRVAVRAGYLVALLLVIGAAFDNVALGHGHIIPRGTMITAVAGLWLSSALFGYFAVKLIRGIDWAWRFLKRKSVVRVAGAEKRPETPVLEILADPSRRYFFKTATAVAGAGPFLGVMYGFAAERLNYQIHRVEIPIANLPHALDGMKIAQLSDIHLSPYMPREQVRRAVEMANGLDAHLCVVTGDFITGAGDPIADCIEELRELRAPLGVWGCNGNHEIYAGAEDAAQRLFTQAGMKLLRQENAQLSFRGANFNLIGVDYQRERSPGGRRVPTLRGAEALVRRDMPNILLSHNPNSFNRAAELGIELSLAGHTHGGQVQVEILDHRLSPARFISDYIAGLYQRPMFAPAPLDPFTKDTKFTVLAMHSSVNAALYVNRGLGTVGAPVRLGVPPEISLLTLRRA